jgi:hypothetical protein
MYGEFPDDSAYEVVSLMQLRLGKSSRRVLAKALAQVARLPDVQDLVAFIKEQVDTRLARCVCGGSTQYCEPQFAPSVHLSSLRRNPVAVAGAGGVRLVW